MEAKIPITSQVKVAIAGNVDAGKSTTIGVLMKNELDNGRGLARCHVMKTKHELVSGRTSAITLNSLEVINESKGEKTKKIITLVDLCGHARYFKTTLFGLTGLFVDYGIIVIGSNMIEKEHVLPKMTREHMSILFHLEIPMIIILTKIDICPPDVYKEIKKGIKDFCTKFGKQKICTFLEKPDPLSMSKYIKEMETNPDNITIVSISNKDGTNINFLKQFLFELKPRANWPNPFTMKISEKLDPVQVTPLPKELSVFYTERTYNVIGAGLIYSGTLRGLPIETEQALFVGPDDFGEWAPLKVKSIRNTIDENVTKLTDRESGCIAVKFNKKVEKSQKFRKGMVIVSSDKIAKEYTSRYFTAKILVLHHSTSISKKYQSVIHCGPIRQAAQIILPDIGHEIVLRTKSKAVVGFYFMFRPEFIEPGMRFFFREGQTRGKGVILSVGLLKTVPFLPLIIKENKKIGNKPPKEKEAEAVII